MERRLSLLPIGEVDEERSFSIDSAPQSSLLLQSEDDWRIDPTFLSKRIGSYRALIECGKKSLNKWLELALSKKASDIDLAPGMTPILHLPDGIYHHNTESPVNSEDVLAIAITSIASLNNEQIISDDLFVSRLRYAEAKLAQNKELDWAMSFNGFSDKPIRLRLHFYFSEYGFCLTMRVLVNEIQDFDKLGIPLDAVQSIISHMGQKGGIGFVTGIVGSGKSTTLAALVHHILMTKKVKIVTVEDPIEYTFDPHRYPYEGYPVQLELGRDVNSYSAGLRRALRERPDIILLQEIRDSECMETCFRAGETGHKILATLHATTVLGTMERIKGMFPASEHEGMMSVCSNTIKFILSQGLIPHVNPQKGRAICCEYMTNSKRDTTIKNSLATFHENPVALVNAMRSPSQITWASCLDRLKNEGVISDASHREFSVSSSGQ